MSITSTLLMFVLLPLAVVVAVSALALVGNSGRRTRRYRPGRPYDFTPIWFLASPEQVGSAGGGPTSAGRTHTPAIESGAAKSGAQAPTGATGGASDRW